MSKRSSMKVDISTDRLGVLFEGELVVPGDAQSFDSFRDRNSGTRNAGLTDSGNCGVVDGS